LAKEPEEKLPARSFVNDELLLKISEKSETHFAVSQVFLVTTSDKIRICLGQYQEALGANTDWIGPAGILATLITTLCIADFQKSFLSFKPEVWQAVFIIAALFSFYFTVRAVVRVFRSKTDRNIDALIEKIKIGQVTSTNPIK
jgi:hypothetical protein